MAVAVALGTPSSAVSENTGNVTVEGNHFVLDEVPFYYAGCNNYYQMVYAANPDLRQYVQEVQSEAAEMGLTVLRTWAFNDGVGQWNALQTEPGVYQEYVFVGLDYVLDLADQHGLRLILPLVNNWDDYGGMNQYAAWSTTANQHDDFYTDENCRAWYRNHIAAVLNRTNTLNGRVYREDPTVFAWELVNEPRCASDPSGATLQAWIEEMSAYVKSIDPDHMVTTGSEGFYGPTGPDHNPLGWMDGVGVDFIPNHAALSIDFATVHAWPDHWGIDYERSMAWVQNHITDSDQFLGKPVVVEEFGKYRPVEMRDQFFQGWLDAVFNAALAGEAAGGSNLWILYHDDYPDHDGFGVYSPADSSTCTILATEAERISSLIPAAGVGEDETSSQGVLSQNFPNPLSRTTSIEYVVSDAGRVWLAIYDVQGRLVRELVDGNRSEGTHSVHWDGKNEAGATVASGTYFYRLILDGQVQSESVIVVR